MGRLLESFFGRSPQMTGPDRAWAPLVDMYETGDDLVVVAELPGVKEQDIRLAVTGDVLTLRGERGSDATTGEASSQYRSERWFGRFERMVALPIPVQADRIKATYREGLLTVRLPKAEEIKPREIRINVQ
jgi:HSP20 family protein